MKLKTLIMTLAATLVCSGVFAQGPVPGATPDTVKLESVDANGATGTFSVQVLISLDSALSGGNLGFSWSDTANWRYDSVSFGPGLLAWTVHTATSDSLANSLGKVLFGGADFFGLAAIPAGPDQLFGTIWFSEKVTGNWMAGDEMLIDSVFVPPGGDFLLIYAGIGGTQVSPHFTGAQKVTFTDVEIVSDGSLLPKTFALAQNYPNPFNPSTKITFDVPKKAHVNLAIYNVLGQQVRTLVNEELDAKRWTVIWEGDNDSGVKVASGMYFYKLISADFVKSRKMMLVK